MKLLITGASGFIGRAFCKRMSEDPDVAVVPVVRSEDHYDLGTARAIVPDIGPDTRWSHLLTSVDVVVHLAAHVHVRGAHEGVAGFRRLNVAASVNLARQAAEQRVRRLVFISTAKVNGEVTAPGCLFDADDTPMPADAYAISKHEAEVELQELARHTGLELVVIRPPLVYGPDVKANFLDLMRWVYKGYPLPFGSVNNQRSLVALDNLVDLIRVCADHPNAANEVFMVSDGEDISTPQLVRRIAASLNRPARLLPMPPRLLEFAAAAAGKHAQVTKLLGNLQVDIRKTRDVLSWRPVIDMRGELRATARRFLESR